MRANSTTAEVRLVLRMLARPARSRIATLATTWVFASGEFVKQMRPYRLSSMLSFIVS